MERSIEGGSSEKFFASKRPEAPEGEQVWTPEREQLALERFVIFKKAFVTHPDAARFALQSESPENFDDLLLFLDIRKQRQEKRNDDQGVKETALLRDAFVGEKKRREQAKNQGSNLESERTALLDEAKRKFSKIKTMERLWGPSFAMLALLVSSQDTMEKNKNIKPDNRSGATSQIQTNKTKEIPPSKKILGEAEDKKNMTDKAESGVGKRRTARSKERLKEHAPSFHPIESEWQESYAYWRDKPDTDQLARIRYEEDAHDDILREYNSGQNIIDEKNPESKAKLALEAIITFRDRLKQSGTPPINGFIDTGAREFENEILESYFADKLFYDSSFSSNKELIAGKTDAEVLQLQTELTAKTGLARLLIDSGAPPKHIADSLQKLKESSFQNHKNAAKILETAYVLGAYIQGRHGETGRLEYHGGNDLLGPVDEASSFTDAVIEAEGNMDNVDQELRESLLRSRLDQLHERNELIGRESFDATQAREMLNER